MTFKADTGLSVTEHRIDRNYLKTSRQKKNKIFLRLFLISSQENQ